MRTWRAAYCYIASYEVEVLRTALAYPGDGLPLWTRGYDPVGQLSSLPHKRLKCLERSRCGLPLV